MRISDWSSDVCSSDLRRVARNGLRGSSSGHRQWANPHFARRATKASIAPDRCVQPWPRKKTPSVATVSPCSGPSHRLRSEEHTSELQSLMRISYAVFCLKTKINTTNTIPTINNLCKKHETHITQNTT